MNLSLLLLNLLFFFAPVKKEIPASIYDFKVAAFQGADIDLSAYKGKKILIVNVPALLPGERQWAQLDELSKKYSDRLVVIGFLTGSFGIAPGSKTTGIDYRKMHYNVSFPLTTKVEVRGPDMDPVFQWLTGKQYNNLKDSYVKWNFQKYLINEKGELVAVFDPKIAPMDPKVIAAIEQ